MLETPFLACWLGRVWDAPYSFGVVIGIARASRYVGRAVVFGGGGLQETGSVKAERTLKGTGCSKDGARLLQCHVFLTLKILDEPALLQLADFEG